MSLPIPRTQLSIAARLLRSLRKDTRANSLIEVATVLPLLVILVCYAVDFGYFFLVSASLTSSARNAGEYYTQGYYSPSQSSLPPLGNLSTPQSVAGTAYGNMSTFANVQSTLAVQLCTNVSGNINCTATPNGSALILSSYQPDADPESTLFRLSRIDVAYTVAPPVPMRIFSIPLLPSLTFHRMTEMRVVN